MSPSSDPPPAPFQTEVRGSVGKLVQIGTVIGNVNLGGWDGNRVLRRGVFAPLLADRLLLHAGREKTLARLEAFVDAGPDGYLVVTAPAGFGKTALAAKLVADRPASVAYHFFTPLYGSSILTEGFFLRNLVEQLAPWYGHTDPLPDEGEVNALRALYHQFLDESPRQPGALLLDGLDEAPRDLAPYLSRTLPAGLRAVLTVRDVGADWADAYRLPAGQYQVLRLGGLARAEVAAVLRQAGAAAFAENAPLLDQVMRVAAYETDPARGADPSYVRFLAEDAASGKLTAENVARAPAGLGRYLDAWWDEVKRSAGDDATRDLFGTLIVARGPIGRAELEAVNPRLVDDWAADKFDEVLDAVRRLVTRDSAGNYALAHPRLRQHLAAKLAPARLRAYREGLLAFCAGWREHRRPYALRYYAQHLAETGEAEPDRRPVLDAALVRLVTDRQFQDLHQEVLDEPAALQRDLERALRLAAADRELGPARVVEAALALAGFRRRVAVPGRLFLDLAAEGKLAEAERRLDLFALQLDTRWYQAILLAFAWLGFAAAPDQARQLRDRVAAARVPAPELDLLLARVAVTLDGAPPPALSLGAPPPPYVAEALVARLAGRGDGHLLGALNPNVLAGIAGELMTGREYLAALDGPPLVALAAADPASGDEILGKYVDVHRTYGYAQYRNRSLWILLDAVLRHPDPGWARRWLGELGATALAPSVEFQEGLDLTVLAHLAAAGNPAALAELLARHDQILTAAAELSPFRGQGDSWGAHKRRLGALVEACSRLPLPGLGPIPAIDAMRRVPFGFAGYEAPACLTVAESLEIARPGDVGAIDEALRAARVSADNVQDETFCARTTARVNAMRARWWGTGSVPFDLPAAIAHLGRDPAAADFAALHRVADAYDHRAPGTTLPIDRLRACRSLRDLAGAYDRPLAELQRLNEARGWLDDEPIPEGAPVNVPDADLAPLLAARLAARALSDGSLAESTRTALIRDLVPIAAANLTALDRVLSRLLLAHRPSDPEALRSLRAAIAANVAPPVADIALPALPG